MDEKDTEKIADEVIKILGVKTPSPAEVVAEIYRFRTSRDNFARLRLRNSTSTKEALEEFLAAIQRLRNAAKKLPDDFGILFDAPRLIDYLNACVECVGKKSSVIKDKVNGEPCIV